MPQSQISKILRESSMRQHQQAENSEFIANLMRGRLDLAAYTRYLVNLAWLYEALEAQVENGVAFESSEPLWDTRLNRVDSITRDLAELGVTDWRTTTEPSAAMKSYIEHLNSLAGKSDFRLVAHHYTRYLGDLSGGQAIAALVARNYGATENQLSFYRFDNIENLVRYKEQYRENLDSLTLDEAQIDELIAEVQLAFAKNQSVFEDLAQPA